MTDSPPVPQPCPECGGEGVWIEPWGAWDGSTVKHRCLACAGTGSIDCEEEEPEEMFPRKNKDPGFRRRFDEATGEFVIEREDVNGWIEVDRYRLSPAPAGEESDHEG